MKHFKNSYLKETNLNNKNSIKRIKDYYASGKLNLPNKPGIYAFWWIGPKKELLGSQKNIILSGPNKKDIHTSFDKNKTEDLIYHCLYIGKTTNIKKRFSLHVKNGSKKRLHKVKTDGRKIKAVTTSCQLRYGIEHIFPSEKNPLTILHDKVGFSYNTDFPHTEVAERFYKENLLIGKWRPWFNLDSER